MNRNYGYQENPENGLGIVRARTQIGNLRSWDIPRDESAIKRVIEDIGESPVPALYMLFDDRSGKKVYIGESSDILSRINNHIKNPQNAQIKNWTRAIVINDGRNASQSDLNDENIRLVLEDYLVRLFKVNHYTVATEKTRSPSLSSSQKSIVESFKDELTILLTRKNKVTKVLSDKGEDEILSTQLKKILEKNNYQISEWSAYEAVINGKKTYIRPGSSKKKGWQITFRDKFKKLLEDGGGYLLVSRQRLPLVEMSVIRDFIKEVDEDAFTRSTIDIFVSFDEEYTFIAYKDRKLDISSSMIVPR